MIPDQFVCGLDGFEAVAAEVPSDRWNAPSPCEGWSAADVVGHVTEGLRTILMLGTGGSVPDDGSSTDEAAGPRSAADADPLTAWRAARAALLASLDDAALARQMTLPWGARMPLGEYVAGYPLELVVHTWDLAQATGQSVVIDPGLVREVLTTAEQFAPVARTAGRIGPERTVQKDADDLTRLLAIFGRQAT